MMVRPTASRAVSADEGTALDARGALAAILLDRLGPGFAHPGHVRQQLAHLARIALHVGADELVWPELVDAEQVTGYVAVEVEPQRPHQQRAGALGAPQQVVARLNV